MLIFQRVIQYRFGFVHVPCHLQVKAANVASLEGDCPDGFSMEHSIAMIDRIVTLW
jgi:hypothetical protein